MTKHEASSAGSGTHPGYLRDKPCALQNSPGMTSYWAFRPSPMGPMQNCCRGLRARTETSTYPGRCVCAPTPAPILRPQDHCESAQVWVGAPNWQLLLHQKGTHTQPTQSTRTLGTPRGRHGRYARQGSWVGRPCALVCMQKSQVRSSYMQAVIQPGRDPAYL